MGEGQCCLTEIFGEEKCPEAAFERRESSRVPDVSGEIVPDVRTESVRKCESIDIVEMEVRESAKTLTQSECRSPR